MNEDVFKSWPSNYLAQCSFCHTLMTMARAGHQRCWLPAQSVSLTLCNLVLHFLTPLFTHLSNKEVGQDLQGLF